jgi:parallel beta-helix repeat protein
MGRLNVKVSAEVDWKGMNRLEKSLLVTVLVAILLVGCVGGVDSLIGYSVSGIVVDSEGHGIPDVVLEFNQGMFGSVITPATGKWLKTGLTGMVTIVPEKEGWVFGPKSVSGAASDLTFIGIQSKDSMDIQKAIDDAPDGDVIIVPPGYYWGTIDFKGKKITLRSQDPLDPTIVAMTILIGNGDGPVVTFRSGETSESRLEGFTITQGTGRLLNAYVGGGVYVGDASPTISNNTIENNNSDWGGGIAIVSGSPTITDNVVKNNKARIIGGGIYVSDDASPLIQHNRIKGNSGGQRGGGIYSFNASPVIRDNVIVDNGCSYWGGGIASEAMGMNPNVVTIQDNLIKSNSASEGGGVSLDSSVAVLEGNQIISNNAQRGGGVYLRWGASAEIKQNRFEGNSADKGGAIAWWNTRMSSTVITENDILSNSARTYGGGISAEDGQGTVFGNYFDGNEAGVAGGAVAILAFQGGRIFDADGNELVVSDTHNIYDNNVPSNVYIIEY